MATIALLFQAVTSEFHAHELRKLIARADLTQFVASVAFVRLDGVDAVAKELKTVAGVSTFYVGIRNDITSLQAVRRLLEIGVKVFAVDTASRSSIFHPKVFLAKAKLDASAIIGSANMTFSGLHNNIEAGAILSLNMANAADKTFVQSLLAVLDGLPGKFPNHVFAVKDAAHAESLFDDGRLVDEDVVIAPAVTSSVRKGERDKLSAMKLARHSPPARKRRTPTSTSGIGVTPETPAPKPVVKISDFALIWESHGLTERDLNIPSGNKTNPTGSMLWKKGAAEGIDQRHFFRDEAFAGVDWQQDKKLPHYERAEANFEIIVKRLDYGTFTLRLSHNTDTTSRTYEQGNAMTSVSWGATMKIIAQRDLLGRIMSLYRRDGNPPEFLIEID